MEITIAMSREEINRAFDGITDAIEAKIESIDDNVNRLHKLFNNNGACFTASDILLHEERVEVSRIADSSYTTAYAIKRNAEEIACMYALLGEINDALSRKYYPSENA